MAYILRGVPHTFQTESQVLSFLRHSPGYMQRQEAYLKRFWPGLYSKVQPAKPARIAGGPKKSKGLLSSVADIAGDVGTAVGTTFAEAALGDRAPQRGPVRTSPVVAGALAGAGGASKAAIDVAAGPETRKVISGLPASKVGLGIEAASILPLGKAGKLGRLLKGAKAAEDAAPVVRTAEEAALAQAREGLKKAPAIRREQEALRRAERAKRSARLDEAIHIDDPVEREAAMKAALKGKYPAIDFAGFKELNDEAVFVIDGAIRNSEKLQPFEKKRALDALVQARKGKNPTKSNQELLERVIGSLSVEDQQSLHRMGIVSDVWNLPRSVVSAFDLSAPFRQGLVLGARHPVIFARNFKPMVKSFMKNANFEEVQNEIAQRANFGRYRMMDLALTDLGSDLLQREEHMISRMAGKIPGISHSNRGYTAFLNKLRADVADWSLDYAARKGVDIDNQKFLKSMGAYINAGSGRGNLGKLEAAGPVLNSFLFSPRLMASRVNMLNPYWYIKQNKYVRRQALQAAAQTGLLVSGLAGLAALAGARVGTDPTSADFGKVRFKNTRFDIAGGFLPYARLGAQLEQGKITSSTTGKELVLGPEGPGKLSKYDITERFVRSKLSPSASLVVDYMKGSDFMGNPIQWDKEVASKFIPLLAQDSHELWKNEGRDRDALAKAVGAYGIGMWGIGLQTYPDKAKDDPKYAKSKGNPYRSKSSGNPYRKRSSSGNPYR